MLTMFCFLLFFFVDSSKPERIERVGYAAIGVLVIFFIVNWCVIFPLKFYELYHSIKNCCKKSKEKKPKRKVNIQEDDIDRSIVTDNRMNQKYLYSQGTVERVVPRRPKLQENETNLQPRPVRNFRLADFSKIVHQSKNDIMAKKTVGKRFDD